jgi:hypothetical protein
LDLSRKASTWINPNVGAGVRARAGQLKFTFDQGCCS